MSRCGKVCYPNRAAAVRSRNRQDRKRDRLLHAYFCGECRRWHLGNTQYTRLENINRIFDRLPPSDRAEALSQYGRHD